MKANELRLGNLVNRKETGEVVTILAILPNTIRTNRGTLPYNCLEPIPLTEEWLFKFGFKRHRLGYFEKGVLFLFKEDGFFSFAPHTRDGEEYFNVKLQCVHSLQNLYFALTGEELTLKY